MLLCISSLKIKGKQPSERAPKGWAEILRGDQLLFPSIQLLSKHFHKTIGPPPSSAAVNRVTSSVPTVHNRLGKTEQKIWKIYLSPLDLNLL